MKKIDARMKKAADEFIISGIKSEAMLKAGYSKQYSHSNANAVFERPEVMAYIEERMAVIDSEKIADQKEVMEFLTAIMRGDLTDETLIGLGMGEQSITNIKISAKDKLKAAELLGKRHQMRTEKVNLSSTEGIKIIDDIG